MVCCGVRGICTTQSLTCLACSLEMSSKVSGAAVVAAVAMLDFPMSTG